MPDARVRTRFAPSPTGALHFGSVRTALFAWLAARHAGGDFILRIEDTDQERYIPGTEALIIETLSWLGLTWDEGPEVGGPHEPYIQSLRIATYRERADELVAAGNAYWCTCTPARLAEMRDAQRARSEPTRYDRRCLTRQDEVAKERAEGMAAVVRLRMPDGVTEWDDLVRGHVSFANSDIDDQVLLKSDGFPTYHLAVVVDDHVMKISDVIRSDEWIPSTPKHLALYAAFGWNPPRFAHVPAVLGPDHQKLSKRRGARNVLEYGELGYLPSAIVNAIALLGWSSGDEQEVFTPEELIERFTLDRVNAAAAIFDPKAPRRPQRHPHPPPDHRRARRSTGIPTSRHEQGDTPPPDPHAPRAHGHPRRRHAPLQTVARRADHSIRSSHSPRRTSTRRRRSQ